MGNIVILNYSVMLEKLVDIDWTQEYKQWLCRHHDLGFAIHILLVFFLRDLHSFFFYLIRRFTNETVCTEDKTRRNVKRF